MNKVKLLIEHNVIEKNKELFNLGTNALIITSPTAAKKAGALDDVIEALEAQNIGYVIYDKIAQNPTVASCIEAAHLGKDCNFVIGIGGGSPLDATKAIAIFVPNQDLDEDSLYQKSWTNQPLEFILVGTTAGTGSEVTKVAVLTDSKGMKHSTNDDYMYAKYAFGDPKYTLSLNREFTISTGIDAICHATEAYFNNKATDESRNYSIKCIKEMYSDLLSLTNNKEITLKQREILYQGSIDGGYAIDVTGTTFGHNLGYYITEHYHLPHGLACACFLNDVIDYQVKNNSDYAQKFFKDINLSIDDFKKILTIIPKNNITMTIEQIDSIIHRWDNNNSVKNTYGKMTVNDIREILIKNFVK